MHSVSSLFKVIYLGIDAKYRKLFLNSTSQFGEDLALDSILGKGKKIGFYVDVGACDPEFLSNTKYFNRRGWRGINIEPNYTNFKKFTELRPRDINLNVGISKERGSLKFYAFDASTLCTFSKEEADKYVASGFKLVEVREVDVVPLRDLFLEHAKGSVIDFLSVDTEGRDLDVLQSNDWDAFRPKAVCVEAVGYEGDSSTPSKPIVSFMQEKGYKLVYFNGLNAIFIDQKT